MAECLRKCRECGKEARTIEDLKAFEVNKGCLFGRQNLCIDCSREYNRKRRLEHPEIYKARNKRTLDKHLHWVECDQCGGSGYSHHDCGEDTCCCLNPENNVECDVCDGEGGWYVCLGCNKVECTCAPYEPTTKEKLEKAGKQVGQCPLLEAKQEKEQVS